MPFEEADKNAKTKACNKAVNAIQDALEDHLRIHQQNLGSLASLFYASEFVSEDEFELKHHQRLAWFDDFF